MPHAEHTIPPPVNAPAAHSRFEEAYIALRTREQWLCTDDELRQLPVVPSAHPHCREWKIRARSSRLLLHYLQKKKKPLQVLEAGCGNGWLSHQLARLPESIVTGTDINQTELLQAERVFGKQQNLHFIQGDIRESLLKKNQYDVIVFAASIQYFPWLNGILHTAFELLAPQGEVHILDSPFYPAAARKSAAARSAAYFEKAGFPGMSDYYFHHVLEDLQQFSYRVLYQPRTWYRQLLAPLLSGPQNPFPWICIINE